jgi:peptidoglycan/xylan/chitin deacetylase (PgdA/CDA1 family)
MVFRGLKASVERALVMTGPAAIARRLAGSSALVLAYHNIVPDGERGGGEESLHLPQQQFAAHLDLLGRTHEVVPLETLGAAAPRRSGRPRVAITFDDGYWGALSAGVAELNRRGFPATFFITPGRLGRHAFWWDRLGRPEHGGVAADIRHHALTVLCGQDEAICAWAGDRALPPENVPPSARSATEADLLAALRVPGMRVAAHSWSHPNLAALAPTELLAELERPLEWLRARWADTLPAVSYPYGLSSPAVAATTQQAGYRAGWLVSGGWLPGGGELPAFVLPRANVPAGLSRAGFELLTSGLRR